MATPLSDNYLASLVLSGKETSEPKDNDLIIKNISFIGTIVQHNGKLFWRDDFWLRRSLETCAELGFYIAQRPSITAYGLTPDNPGENRDFLDPQYSSAQTDLALFGLVYHKQNRTNKTMCGRERSAGCRQSPRHNEPDIWPQALNRSQAKIVVTIADLLNPEEIRTCHLINENYVAGPAAHFQAFDLNGSIMWVKLETLINKSIMRKLPIALTPPVPNRHKRGPMTARL